MKTKSILPVLFALVFFSCSKNEETNVPQQKQDSERDNFGEGFSLGLENLKINFDESVTYHYSDLEERDSIIRTVIKEIYEVGLDTNTNENGQTISEELAVNLVIDASTNTLVFHPETIHQVVESNTVYGYDKDNGFKNDDGWKSYGACQSESCVEAKYKEAVAAFSNSVTPGKCLGMQLRINKVSTRLIAC